MVGDSPWAEFMETVLLGDNFHESAGPRLIN